MKIIRYITLTLALLIPLSNISTAQAQDRDIKEMLEECFWGLLFEDEDDRQISLALNILSGSLGTYAVLSGLLSPDALCASKKALSLAFISETYPTLVEETAKGEGEYLSVALTLAGCESANHGAAIAGLRSQMPAILEAAAAGNASVEGVSSYYEGLQSAVAQSCPV